MYKSNCGSPGHRSLWVINRWNSDTVSTIKYTYDAVLYAETKLIFDMWSFDEHFDYWCTRHKLQPHYRVLLGSLQHTDTHTHTQVINYHLKWLPHYLVKFKLYKVHISSSKIDQFLEKLCLQAIGIILLSVCLSVCLSVTLCILTLRVGVHS